MSGTVAMGLIRSDYAIDLFVENMPPHLFVVEDDAEMRQMLSRYLTAEGMTVTAMDTF